MCVPRQDRHHVDDVGEASGEAEQAGPGGARGDAQRKLEREQNDAHLQRTGVAGSQPPWQAGLQPLAHGVAGRARVRVG